MNLPYKAEYAKSGRLVCHGCKSLIGKYSLRLAALVQSLMFDSRAELWYHQACFFKKQRPKTIDDIENFESLRWEDQERIRSRIENLGTVVVPATQSKKRNAAAAAPTDILEDFAIEYAKFSCDVCQGCRLKIMKDEIRISKKDYESDIGKRYGGKALWHHMTCFARLRTELGFLESADKIPGFKSLRNDDKEEVQKQIPAIKQEEIPEKKAKTEEDRTDSRDPKLETKLKTQNTMLFSYRDELRILETHQLRSVLQNNNQEVPRGREEMLDRLCDIMVFGALARCYVCGNGQLVLGKFGYKCQGYLTEWSRCDVITKRPKRIPFVPTSCLAALFDGFSNYKYVNRVRLFRDIKPTVSSTVVKNEKGYVEPKILRQPPPLYDMKFVVIGNMNGKKDEIKKRIVSFGGNVTTRIEKTVMAVISTAEDMETRSARIMEAIILHIHVVPPEFLDEVKEYSGRIPELVLKTNICSWGTDPHLRLPSEPSSSGTKSIPSKITLKLIGGGTVDPESGLVDRASVYQSGKDKYTCVLGITDIQRQKNSYYKLQLLQYDFDNRYWLFYSWGRIGTTIGGNKLSEMSLDEAKDRFCELYHKKTGNLWCNRDRFVKRPGLMYPIDVNYGEEEAKLAPSKLSEPVQELIRLIFDIKEMEKVMLEFELDTEKMPLGKLSKSQLRSAFSVLKELQRLVETGGSKSSFIDASNRFYTFVPHSLGMENPPVINNHKMIKEKIKMVTSLLDLEIAYNLMIRSYITIDGRYEQLKTDIETLDRTSEEYEIIREYVKNTHAVTHDAYELDVLDVFTVKRHGEEKRFEPFRKLHNRKLLWHGSRTTNFASILSEGLRIAPPEAPATGYMFGKGIYFADMVSKSANYCCPGTNNVGLLLLCEVALGEMYELEHAGYVEKLPKGKHSVKGIGTTEPDPQHSKKLPGGVHVPLGKGMLIDTPGATSLLYNEYIIYDVAQVKMKYLVKVNFKPKY